jgi:hypothetical protein
MTEDMSGGMRSWRVMRTQSNRWVVERLSKDQTGGEVREISATYHTRQQAERAITQSMRTESRRWKRS